MFIRKSARALLINSENKILLFKFKFPEIQGEKVLWVTPGGGVEEHETFEQALKRELFEETGLVFNSIGSWVWTKEVIFNGTKGDFISYERYYLVKSNNVDISFENMTLNEVRTLNGFKWWSIDELLSSSEEFFTQQVGKLLLEIILGSLPNSPINIC
ncbi:RNA pyrophosphohydrolase [Clostridium homopropionicum DSM 5847]|uniref:RNA pyrophosphohydrolase n=1 Tax=Clostridium homopropionicum DSM 5847 TaxID=1121318 RepID=A0A0L6ZA19_9CLOT|nr:NUDIX domain-containing protein [Clostridium homopropionicum]KOA19638.1 RNA pyrophosphohydrolase [Clostridium homopropionicum DSM 5847]SFF81151.1 NUDIX domain-containing protein [Clostridium homopropionicum]